MFSRFKKTHLSDLVKLSGVFIGPGIEAEGDIKTEEDVFIDAKFKGNISSNGVIELGKNSSFVGGLQARSLIMEGLAKANANAVDSISFAGCSEFSGNAQSRNIIVEKGAVINAKLITEKN